jgi:hypothetical protein
MKIGIFTAVCERDFLWFPQFKRQIEILGYPVAFFADKLSPESLKTLKDWPLTYFVHQNETEQFSERSKGFAFVGLKGFDWAIQMDIDETWQDGAKEILEKTLVENKDKHVGECEMVTVMRQNEELHRRADKYFLPPGREGSRARIYNNKFTWRWIDPITCGAYLFIDEKLQESCDQFWCDAATVHWGYSTYELCDDHKQKWVEVYTKVWGKMPYAAYELLTDRTVQVEKIPLDPKYYKHLWTDHK